MEDGCSNETCTTRTRQHSRQAPEQCPEHGAHRLKGRLAEERSSVEAGQRKETGEEVELTHINHVRGPYEVGGADDDAFQLGVKECTIADLRALASRSNVGVTHILAALTRGTRRLNRRG